MPEHYNYTVHRNTEGNNEIKLINWDGNVSYVAFKSFAGIIFRNLNTEERPSHMNCLRFLSRTIGR